VKGSLAINNSFFYMYWANPVAGYRIVARKFSIGRICSSAGGLFVCAGGLTL